MTPSRQVLDLVVVRFLCRPEGATVFRVSPYAAPWARRRGVPLTERLMAPATDEWWSYRLLTRHERLIASRHEHFADLTESLVAELPSEVERYVEHVSPEEFRILLVYAGQGVYDFFARDHRFGAPPRGKVFRTNLRAQWSSEPRRPRANQCVISLRTKIRRARGLGADVTDLEVELRRREEALSRGEDPMVGLRTWEPGSRPRRAKGSVEPLQRRPGWAEVVAQELGVEPEGEGPTAEAPGGAPSSPPQAPGGATSSPPQDPPAPVESGWDTPPEIPPLPELQEELRNLPRAAPEPDEEDWQADERTPGGVDFSRLPDLPDWVK